MTSDLPFSRGDQVRMTERYAIALMKCPGCKIDWVHRRGTVRACNRTTVTVLWPGRSSVEIHDVRSVVKD
jgi:hypothetical protein